jgi:hypothetical protein|tara:strand:- start:1 stop:609 length:609 start_codon:yes stop_codon:yes gene_type:complete
MSNTNEATAVPERFTSNGSDLLTKSVAAESRGRIAAQKATDAMIADGMLWTDFISPAGKSGESTSTPELHKALKHAILKGLGAPAVKMHALPIKALSEADKATKASDIKLIGRMMSAQRDAIRLRTDKEFAASKSKAKSRAPQQKKTGDKVVDEANAIAMKAIKKETDLQHWHANNLSQDTAVEIGKLRAQIIALLQPEPSH